MGFVRGHPGALPFLGLFSEEYFRIHKFKFCNWLGLRTFFNIRSFTKKSFLIRGLTELENSKGLKLKTFKNAYEAYCDKKGLQQVDINQVRIEKVCRKFLQSR